MRPTRARSATASIVSALIGSVGVATSGSSASEIRAPGRAATVATSSSGGMRDLTLAGRVVDGRPERASGDLLGAPAQVVGPDVPKPPGEEGPDGARGGREAAEL